MTLERIDFKKRRFKGLERSYAVHGSISAGRYAYFEKLQLELAFGAETAVLIAGMKEVYELMDKSKNATAAVRLWNHLEAVGRIEQGRQHPMLYICTLFCNYDGEDLSKWSTAEADVKIADWGNISMDDFFSLAASSITGLIQLWQEASRSISEAKESLEI